MAVMMTNLALIERAKAVVNPQRIGDHLIGDVGAALVTDQGRVYTGVCMDLPSGIGFCAEHSAIAAMVTAGERRIARIVAVWLDDQGRTFVVAPCGRCREFMRLIHPDNLSAHVLLSADKALPLAELLPHHNGFEPL